MLVRRRAGTISASAGRSPVSPGATEVCSLVSAALAEAPQTAPPDFRCLLCPPPRDGRSWRRSDPGYRTCSSCLDRVRERLAEVRDRYAVLDPRPGASGEHGGRGAPGFGSRSPAADVVVAVRDWRSTRSMSEDATVYDWDPLADDVLEPGQLGPPRGAYVAKRRGWLGADGRVHRESERPPLSVLGELFTLARHVADARGQAGPLVLTVADIARWLDAQLDWVSRQDGVVAFDRVLRELVGQLRPLTGEPRPKRIGECPNVIDEGEHTRECKAPLFAPLHSDRIQCRACGREWPRPEWEDLGRILQVIA